MFRKREFCLYGDKVLIVPYSPHHVERYHQWLQDPVLREQTASDLLTLEKEYEMQSSWMRDEDKCTFIILDKEVYKDKPSEVDSMVGDVNLFLGKYEESDLEKGLVAEIDIMIAEKSSRGKGFGMEATNLMISYGAQELGVVRFRAKVGMSNKPSIHLFRDKLKFKEVSQSQVFKEVTLELVMKVEEQRLEQLNWTKYMPKLQN